jgi:phosphonate transport system substrate-binding protein
VTIQLPERTTMLKTVIAAAVAALSSTAALAQDACPNRGMLDTIYCDADGDLVADLPMDAARRKDPSTLIFAYSPVENPAVYQSVFQPFMDHLASCTGKRVVYYPAQSNTAQIEAMRSGRLHISGFATGVVGFAVNMAGAIPIAAMGSEKGMAGYQVWSVVKADSPYQKLADLKGRKVAHVSPSSNSGNLAPRVYFKAEGLVPDADYKPLMSGGHDKSILGVQSGDYDMAPIASDVMERMVARGHADGKQLRIIWKSPMFPTSSFSMAHDLKPELQTKVRECFASYRFGEAMRKEFTEQDRFLPMTYKETWKPLREVAEQSGTPYNKAAYDAQVKRDADAAAKKAAAPPAAPKQ